MSNLLFSLAVKKMDELLRDNNLDEITQTVTNTPTVTELTSEMTTDEVAYIVRNIAQNRIPRFSMWQSGDEIGDGRYVIERKIGSGGFGITYLATSYRRELVVIKTLKEQLSDREDFHRREEDFVNEALQLSRFRHPNIVPIIEVINDRGWCIVMEYIKGKTLATKVRERDDYLTSKEAIRYIKQIGAALKEVHAHGLLHRDVKPQNIMIEEATNNAVLIDFGLALNFEDNSAINSSALTHGYAALEQYQFNVIWNCYTDIYALAATLYFMLTKTKPISAKERAGANILASPKDINPAISEELNEAIERGMALDAANRPQTVEQWLELLERKPKPQFNRKSWLLSSLFVCAMIPIAYWIIDSIINPPSPPPIDPEIVNYGETRQGRCTEYSFNPTIETCQFEYILQGTKGDEVTITMNGDEVVDPLLILVDPENSEIARNDDIHPDTFDARITQVLPEDGNYRIISRLAKGETGDYTLMVTKE